MPQNLSHGGNYGKFEKRQIDQVRVVDFYEISKLLLMSLSDRSKMDQSASKISPEIVKIG